MAQTPDGTILGGFVSYDRIVGAGGFITHADAADDGTVVICSDAAGPHIRRPGDTAWTRLMRAGQNFPAADMGAPTGEPGIVPFTASEATIDVTICATNSDVIAWFLDGFVYRTEDGGETVFRCNLTRQTGLSANDQNVRTIGKLLQIDPNNADVMIVAAPAGCLITTDGGDNWTPISTSDVPATTFIPATSSYRRHIIAFDRNSVSGGRSQTIAIASPGNGIYRTTNAGTSWAAIASAPTTPGHMIFGNNGWLHVCGTSESASANGSHSYWNGTSWTPTGVSSKSIAASPHTSTHLFVCDAGGTVKVSADSGATFPYTYGKVRVANNIPWHAWCNENYMTHGTIVVQGDTNVLWILEGIGAWRIINPQAASGSPDILEESVGIENMVTTGLRITPTGKVLYACHDRHGMTFTRDQIDLGYPLKHAGTNAGASIVHGGDMNFAGDNENVLAMTTFSQQGEAYHCGYFSTDGGTSWQAMASNIATDYQTGGFVDAGGGGIVLFTENVWVQKQVNKGRMMRTTDQGATWTQVADIPFVAGDELQGYHAYYLDGMYLVQDQDAPTTTAYFYSPSSDTAKRGVWKTTNAGLNWSRVRTSYIKDGGDIYHTKLVQYGVDDWLWCGGDNSVGVKRSTDGMVTWSDVSGTDDILGAASFGEIYCLAVGAPATLGGPKTVVAIGHRAASPSNAPTTYDGYGVWMSTDEMLTWKRIDQFVDGHYVSPLAMVGDPERFGIFYIGLASQGILRLKYRDVRTQTSSAPAANPPEIWFGWGDSNGYWQDTREAQDTDWPGVYQVRFRAPIGVSADTTPLDQLDNSGVANGLSLYEYFGKQRAEDIGADVYLVMRNFPGTAMSNVSGAWGDGLTAGNHTATVIGHYNTAIQQVLAVAPTAVPKGFIHTIGTNDAAGGDSSATVKSQLGIVRTAMINGVYQNGVSGATVGALDWLVIGTIPEGYGPGTVRYPAEVGLREFAQENAANNVKIYKVPEGNNRGVDTIHYSLAGHRSVGAACATLLTDTAPPTSTFPTTYTLLAGQKMLLDLTSGLDKYAWCALSGAGAGDFEITMIRDADTGVPGSRLRQYLRWNADGTKTAGTYAVDLNWTAGNGEILTRTFTVTVQAAYGTQVETIVATQQTHFTGAVTKDARLRPNIPVTLGRGKNLIYIQNTLGPLTDISSVMFNGIAATRDANSNSTVDTYLFYLNSAVDQTGTLIITPSDSSSPTNMDIMVVSVVGTVDAVSSSSVMPSAQRINTAHETASLTCPASGIIVGLGMIPSPTTIKTGCTSIYLSGNYWSQYRTTTGVCGYTGGNNQFSRFAAAAFAKA